MGTPLLTPRLLGCACELILNCPKVLVSERRALVAALREITLLNHFTDLQIYRDALLGEAWIKEDRRASSVPTKEPGKEASCVPICVC